MATPGGVVWESDDRLVVEDTTYALMNEPLAAADLRLFKPRVMLQEYDPLIVEFQGANIVEIGILEGGSTAYFAQRCDPRTLIGVERSPERVEELDRFVDAHGLGDQVRLHYGVDQADGARLREIAAAELGGEAIDLVIDDASHLYHPTVASFEALFPLVRPGGMYIIEDWTADDWLVVTFATAIAHREPMARAVVEDWIAKALRADDGVVSVAFDRWIVSSLADPTSRYHEEVSQWCAELDRPGASNEAPGLREHVREVVASGGPDTSLPTLGTLGLQLLLAVKGLCPAISSVSVTPWWIAVRRGGPVDPETFSVELIGRDELGLLDTHANAHPRRSSD